MWLQEYPCPVDTFLEDGCIDNKLLIPLLCFFFTAQTTLS